MKYYTKLEQAKANFQPGNLIFAKDVLRNGIFFKTFAIFQDDNDFIEHYNQRQDKHFYEIIEGIQRPYMDIDVKNVHIDDQSIEHFVAFIKSKYYTHVNVYTSHRENRQSFHILLANVCVMNHIQCKSLIEDLLNMYDDPYNIKQHIDMRVYKSSQQLRLLGSSKIGIDNYKRPWRNEGWNLRESLVAYYHNPNYVQLINYDRR